MREVKKAFPYVGLLAGNVATYEGALALIDGDLCTGCEVCAQLCPHDAILTRDQVREAHEHQPASCTTPVPGGN